STHVYLGQTIVPRNGPPVMTCPSRDSPSRAWPPCHAHVLAVAASDPTPTHAGISAGRAWAIAIPTKMKRSDATCSTLLMLDYEAAPGLSEPLRSSTILSTDRWSTLADAMSAVQSLTPHCAF